MASVHRPRTTQRTALALAAVLSVAACASTPPVVPLQPAPLGRAATQSEQVVSLVGLGDRARAEGRLKDGLAYYAQALALEPQNPALMIRYGDALAELDRHADALDALARAVALAPDDASANIAYAQVLLTVGRVDDARGFIDKALVLRPDDREALIALGVANDLQGRHEEASDAYRRVLEQVPGDPVALGNLALSRALAGDTQGAGAAAARLPNDDPAAAATVAMVAHLSGGDIDPRFAADPAFRRNLDQFLSIATRPAPVASAPSAWDVVAAPGSAAPAAPAPAAAAVRASALPEPAAGRAPGRPDPVVAPPTPPRPSAVAETRAPQIAAGVRDGSEDDAWVVRIGHYPNGRAAADAWQKLRARLPAALARTQRLAGGEAAQPIVLGPFGGRARALTLCAALPAETTCEPTEL